MSGTALGDTTFLCLCLTMNAPTPKNRAIRNKISRKTWSKMMSAVGIL